MLSPMVAYTSCIIMQAIPARVIRTLQQNPLKKVPPARHYGSTTHYSGTHGYERGRRSSIHLRITDLRRGYSYIFPRRD